jgi:hypothetical protein
MDDDLSEDEARARKRLIEVCKEIVEYAEEGDDEEDDEQD